MFFLLEGLDLLDLLEGLGGLRVGWSIVNPIYRD